MEATQSPKARMPQEGGYPTAMKVTLPVSPPPKIPESISSLRKKMGMTTASLGAIETRAGSTASSDSWSLGLPGQPLRSPQTPTEESELLEDDASSEEEEASSLESEDSSDEEDDDGFSSLDIHPMHCKQNSSGVKLPVFLTGCTDAKKLATQAAADAKVGIRQGRLMKTHVARGKLTGSASDFTMVVDLIHASVAVHSCTRSLAQGQAAVCVVPAHIEPGLVQEAKRARRPSTASVVKSVKDAFSGGGTSPLDKDPVMGYLFCCPVADLHTVLAALARQGCYLSGVEKYYKVLKGEKAGSGSFGTVVVGHDSEGSMVAIKRMRENTAKAVLEQEVKMLVLAQGHSTIIKFRACFQEEEAPDKMSPYSIVFDYHSRGDLYDRVAEGSRLQEKQAMTPFRDLLDALAHLHARDIFHRDVKPENLLVVNSSNKVVLTDFGIATLISNKEEMKKSIGTIGYASPEMLSGTAAGYEGDAFGAGIVLYFMLSRSTPFLAPTNALMAAKTLQCQVNLKYQCFDHMTDHCRSLILQLLLKSTEERMTVEEALKVPTVQTSYVTATEPSLASMARKPSSAPKSADLQESEVAKPAHHMISLSVGELPALQKIPYGKK